MNRLMLISSVLGASVLLIGCKPTVVNTTASSDPVPTTVITPSTTPNGVQYSGTKLAGNTALFLEFNAEDYAAAQAAGQIILLDFYADWCPICRAEEPAINAGFDALTVANVVGFRVHYNDALAGDAERALAKQFGVTYQHTKVIVRDGAVVSLSLESWTAEDLVAAVEAAL